MTGDGAPAGRRPITVAAGVVVGLVIVLVLFTLFSPEAAPKGAGPGGTLALRRLLVKVGHVVLDGDATAAGEAYVLLKDRRGDREVGDVLEWVAEGGHLVVADPQSKILVTLGVGVAGPIPVLTGGARTEVLRGDCFSSLAAGASTVEVRTTDMQVHGGFANQLTCFASPPGPYEVIAPFRKGTVVVLGGPSALQNSLLNHADNARFALSVLGSRHVVRFGSAHGLAPAPSAGPGSVWGAIPFAVKMVLLELFVALVAFALVRARRLGQPVEERPIAPIPAGELVRATSRLYRKGRARAFSGTLLRQGAELALRGRLGLPSDAPTEHVIEEAARIGGRPTEVVRRALDGAPVGTDDELIALGREVEEIRRAVETATR